MSKPGKVQVGQIIIELPAGSATPAGKIGQMLGGKVANIMEFCKTFNDATKNFEKGIIVSSKIALYADKTFDCIIKGVPVSSMIKKEIALTKGSTAPGRTSAGTISWDQIKRVATEKMKQGLSARDVAQAMKIVAGSARSMGLKVTGVMPTNTTSEVNNG